MDEFLKEFDKIDCENLVKMDDAAVSSEELNTLCPRDLRLSALSPLGNFATDQEDFYSYLKNQIFDPLAYDVKNEANLSQLISNVIELNPKDSKLFQKNVPLSLNEAQRGILTEFQSLVGLSSDINSNKNAISRQITKILKRFHVYWNALRNNGEYDLVKENTKKLISNVMKQYVQKENTINYVSTILIQKLIKVYYDFVKAHRTVTVIEKEGEKIITNQILRRYNNICESYVQNEFTEIKIVHEMSFLIDLITSFYITCYKMRKNEPVSLQIFKHEIMRKVKEDYAAYGQRPDVTDANHRNIREFTAIFLLKAKFAGFYIFHIHSIGEYVNLPFINFLWDRTRTTKIYYEVFDNMIRIPSLCINYLIIKTCAYHLVNLMIRYINSKYQLKRSSSGFGLFDYVRDLMGELFSKINSEVWMSWSLFKINYFQSLFSVMYNYKKKFLLRDMDNVDDLETYIGLTIDNFQKKFQNSETLNFGLIAQLDKDLYNFFLEIKGDYNPYAPVSLKADILKLIILRLNNFLESFQRKYPEKTDSDFHELIKEILSVSDAWRMTMNNHNSQKIVVGSYSTIPEVYEHNIKNFFQEDKDMAKSLTDQTLLTKSAI